MKSTILRNEYFAAKAEIVWIGRKKGKIVFGNQVLTIGIVGADS